MRLLGEEGGHQPEQLKNKKAQRSLFRRRHSDRVLPLIESNPLGFRKTPLNYKNLRSQPAYLTETFSGAGKIELAVVVNVKSADVAAFPAASLDLTR